VDEGCPNGGRAAFVKRRARSLRFGVLGLAGLAICAAPAFAHGGRAEGPNVDGVQPEEAAKIEAVLRSIIEAHPEIVAKALEDYERAKKLETEAGKAALIATLRPEIEADRGGFALGPSADKAKANVVFLFDYHCAPCKRATLELTALAATYPDVRFTYKEMPILRSESRIAAKAALAARRQNKYVALHTALMTAPGVLTQERIAAIAADAGLNVEQLDEAMGARALDDELEATLRITRNLKIEATPSFFVNGEYLPGRDNKRLQEMIDKARATAGAAARAASD